MGNPTFRYILMGACLLLMLVGIIGVFVNKRNSGLSIRSIQALVVLLFIPTVIILAVLEVLKSDSIAALLGGLAGYVLSSLTNHEAEETKRRRANIKENPLELTGTKGPLSGDSDVPDGTTPET